MTEEQEKEFTELSDKLVKFLNDNFDPHVTIMITPVGSVIQRMMLGINNFDHLKD